jgi:hypothetical protein
MRDIINQVLKKELSEQEENLNDNPDPNEVDRRSYDRQIYIYLWDNTKNDISSACTATTGISLYVGLTVDEDKRYKAHIKNFKSAREGQQVRGGDAKQKSAVERFINRCRVKNKMRFDAYRPIYPKRITAEQAKSDELCLIQGFKREENENLNVLNVHQQTSSLGGCTRFTRSVIYDVTHYELMGNQGAVLPPAILNYYTKKDMKAAFDLGAENKFFLEDYYSFDELLNKVGELNDLNDYKSFLTRIKKDKGYHKRSDLTKLIENLGILFPKNIENKVYVVTSDLSRTYDSLYDAVKALGENNRSYLSDNLRDNFEEFYRQRDLSKKIKFNSNRTIALIPKYRLSNFTFKPGDDLLGSVDTKIDRFFREREQQLVNNLNETQKIIKKILQEETSDRAKEKLLSLKDKIGLNGAMKAVGGLKNFIKITYSSDIKEFFKNENIEPYRISSEPNMYFSDIIVQSLDLPDASFSNGLEKDLGKFSWVSGGMRYSFNAYLRRVNFTSGNIEWRVVGQSGDSGFGYGFITKRNTLGKRARMQIFQQIIDKYNLDSYK